MIQRCVAVAILAAVGAAQAQFSSGGFEAPTYAGSAGGTLLTGQQGWYVPIAGSSDFNVYTYAGNVLNVPLNPQGSQQFVGNLGQLSPGLGRAQQNLDFSAGGRWTASWDVLARFDGPVGTAATQFPGSFSLQNSVTDRYFQQLMSWDDVNNPTTFTINYLSWDAAGLAQPGGTVLAGAVPPGPEWQNLPVNHWYRESIIWDFATNLIVSIHLTDLTTSQTWNAFPNGWYLHGGASPTRPMPTAFRLFTGGAGGNNLTAWDNVSVIPAPGAGTALLAMGLLLARRRRQ